MPVEGEGSRSGGCSPRAPVNLCLASYLKNMIQGGSIRIGTLQPCFGVYVARLGLIGHRAQTERQLVYGE